MLFRKFENYGNFETVFRLHISNLQKMGGELLKPNLLLPYKSIAIVLLTS